MIPEYLQEFDLIGFGALVTGYQPIYFFKDFMKGQRNLDDKGLFFYCTYGAKFGRALKVMHNALKKSGGTILGGEAFTVSDEAQRLFYIGKYFNHDRPNGVEFSQTALFVETILSNYHQWQGDEHPLVRYRKGG